MTASEEDMSKSGALGDVRCALGGARSRNVKLLGLSFVSLPICSMYGMGCFLKVRFFGDP